MHTFLRLLNNNNGVAAVKTGRWQKLKPFVLLLFAWLAICACTTNRIRTNSMELTVLEQSGQIDIKLLNSKGDKHLTLTNSLLNSTIKGAVAIKKFDDGSVGLEKKLSDDSLGAASTMAERFIPTDSGVRCEFTIKGDGKPWGTVIETALNYPVEDGSTKVWATWAAPPVDSSVNSESLNHQLRKIGPKKREENTHYWVDPLVPVPFTNATYFYGAPGFEYNNMRIGFVPFQGDVISIPLATILNEKDNTGVSIVLSPKDTTIDMSMNITKDGTIKFNRYFNRISKQNNVKFTFDIVVHESDWRCGLGWMQGHYPEYFRPGNQLAQQLDGTAAYATFANESMNFDIDKMKRMAFATNWQASFDFPYMGMFIPPVNANEKWQRFGGDEISIQDMDLYAKRYSDNGFYVLNYFNVTEFGANIKYPPQTAQNALPDSGMWKDANAFLYTKLRNAILPVPEKSIQNAAFKNAAIPVPHYTWRDGVAVDCGDSAYYNFLVDQAEKHVKLIPHAYGICVDRLDWVRLFNERADDGVTWFDGKPVRSMLNSWKNIAGKLSSVMHGANKVVFANNHSKRIDILQHVDGLFDEFTYAGTSLNLTAFLCISKPALGWTDNNETIRNEGGDNFMQKYLYMGVFPMCPFPKNDHSIMPSGDIDSLYLDYGPLLNLLKGSEWVLKPNAVKVTNNTAKANIFKIKDGYAVPVVYGEKDMVEIVLNNIEGVEKEAAFTALYPGDDKPVTLNYKKDGAATIVTVPLKRGCSMLYIITVK